MSRECDVRMRRRGSAVRRLLQTKDVVSVRKGDRVFNGFVQYASKAAITIAGAGRVTRGSCIFVDPPRKISFHYWVVSCIRKYSFRFGPDVGVAFGVVWRGVLRHHVHYNNDVRRR